MGEFRMPSLGADMDVGTIVEWLVKPGDAVHRGQIVAVVDTAKAAIEVEAFEEGVVAELLVDVGATVPVGAALARITPDPGRRWGRAAPRRRRRRRSGARPRDRGNAAPARRRSGTSLPRCGTWHTGWASTRAGSTAPATAAPDAGRRGARRGRPDRPPGPRSGPRPRDPGRLRPPTGVELLAARSAAPRPDGLAAVRADVQHGRGRPPSRGGRPPGARRPPRRRPRRAADGRAAMHPPGGSRASEPAPRGPGRSCRGAPGSPRRPASARPACAAPSGP